MGLTTDHPSGHPSRSSADKNWVKHTNHSEPSFTLKTQEQRTAQRGFTWGKIRSTHPSPQRLVPVSPVTYSGRAGPTPVRAASAVASPAFGCVGCGFPNFAEGKIWEPTPSFPLRVSGPSAPRGWHSPFLPRSVKERGLQDAPNSTACLPPVRA